MAAPEGEVQFSDTELSSLVGKLKPEDIDALTDEEVKRLGRLMEPNPPANDPTKTDPLAGKPTMA